MFWYNVISNNPSYYFKMYISEITKKKKKKWLKMNVLEEGLQVVIKLLGAGESCFHLLCAVCPALLAVSKWYHTQAPPLTGCVTFSKLPNLAEPQSLHP